MNNRLFKCVANLLLCMSLMTSCGSDSKDIEPSPLQLLSVKPVAGERVAPGTVEVVFEFDQPITINDAAKITLNNQLVENAYAVARYLKAKVEVAAVSTNIFKIDLGALSIFPTDRMNEDVYSIEFTATAWDNPGGPAFDITPVPCNPNADDGAKALYTWMLRQFGKKMISGSTQEEENFGYVHQITGKTPLLKGWDMQPYSPAYTWLWKDGGYAVGPDLDNSNTSDAIAWYNDNGQKPIIAFSWHWHSPMGGEPGKNSFYAEETTFDASRAVIEGTEEYEATMRDIDAIAEQLKKLRDAGVPVLWRPLHEASGGWFWWSTKGPDVYKKLWNMMYERFTNHHQLNNLLWVWNDDKSEWYVGDDKCDIISADVGQDGVYRSEFEKAYNITGGKKMQALSETGIVPDCERALSEEVYWSYWMTWQDAVKNTGPEELRDIFDNPNVITLENCVK